MNQLEKEADELTKGNYSLLKDIIGTKKGQHMLAVEEHGYKDKNLLGNDIRRESHLGIIVDDQFELLPFKDVKDGIYIHDWGKAEPNEPVVVLPMTKFVTRSERRKEWQLKEGRLCLSILFLNDLDSDGFLYAAHGHYRASRLIIGNDRVETFFKMDSDKFNAVMERMKSTMDNQKYEEEKKYGRGHTREYFKALFELGIKAPEDSQTSLLGHLDEQLRIIIRQRGAKKLGFDVKEELSDSYIRQVIADIRKYDSREDTILDEMGFKLGKQEILRQLENAYQEPHKEGAD